MMTVDITIPVYNEEKALRASIGQLVDFLRDISEFEGRIVMDLAAADSTCGLSQEQTRTLSWKYQNLIQTLTGCHRAASLSFGESARYCFKRMLNFTSASQMPGTDRNKKFNESYRRSNKRSALREPVCNRGDTVEGWKLGSQA